MSDPTRHLTYEEIVARFDEPDEARDDGFRAHLAACEPCRARLAETEELFAALRTEPPAAGEPELVAGRERILAAIAERPRPAGRRLSRRVIWLPLAAAAVIAAILILAPREPRTPEGTDRLATESATISAPSAIVRTPALPVIVEASRAAEEVLEAAGPDAAVSLVETPLIDTGVADGVPVTDEYEERIELETAFADLPNEDREAILDELASIAFDLPRP